MSQTQRLVVTKVPLTRVELLLRIRQDMHSRQSGPYVYIGVPNVDRVECFLVGYARGVGSFGFDPGQDGLFGDWLRDVKKAWPGEGWAAAYLRELDGDHTRALRKYVDYAAEFRLEIRRVGRIGLYIGYARVERMAGYLDGYRLGLSLAGLKDEEYPCFERWLQDTGRLPPGSTWEASFLQAARGDHEAAIHRFLDCSAGFRAFPPLSL